MGVGGVPPLRGRIISFTRGVSLYETQFRLGCYTDVLAVYCKYYGWAELAQSEGDWRDGKKLGVPRFSLPRHSPLDSTLASYSNSCRKYPKNAPISFDVKGAIAFDLPLDWPLL